MHTLYYLHEFFRIYRTLWLLALSTRPQPFTPYDEIREFFTNYCIHWHIFWLKTQLKWKDDLKVHLKPSIQKLPQLGVRVKMQLWLWCFFNIEMLAYTRQTDKMYGFTGAATAESDSWPDWILFVAGRWREKFEFFQRQAFHCLASLLFTWQCIFSNSCHQYTINI